MRFLLFIPIFLGASLVLTTWSLLRWWHGRGLSATERALIWREPSRDERFDDAWRRQAERRIAAARAVRRAEQLAAERAAFQAAEEARIAAALAQPRHDWVETLPLPLGDGSPR